MDARKDVMASKPRPHICSPQYCNPVCELDLVEAKILPRSSPIYHPAVYVCVFKQMHVCTSDRCMEYVGTVNGTCPVTGIYHGHTEGEKAWVMPEKRTAHFKRNGVKALQGLTATGISADASREQQLQYRQTIERIETGHDGDDDTHPNIFNILKNTTGETKRPAAADEEELPLALVKKKKPKKYRNYEEDARSIINKLLYSNERKHINDDKRDILIGKRNSVIRNYYEERKGKEFPILVDVLGIKASFDMEPPHMKILKEAPERIAYYVSVIMQTWNIVLDSPWAKSNPGVRFEPHVLGVLYTMRKGLIIDNAEYIPADKYLLNLPVRIDLPLFDTAYTSKSITNYMKNLKNAYKSAIEAGWTREKLQLKFLNDGL